jgi:hypothetical protein
MKSLHIVLLVLAALAALYGVYLGVGQTHNYPEGLFYLVLGLDFAAVTKVT